MPGIANLKVAVLATDGFEQVELTEPVKALRAASAQLAVYRAAQRRDPMNHHEKGENVAVDYDLASASAERFDALVLPGGVANPDTLRTNRPAVAFVRNFVQANKPIAAICHGPWTLIEADGMRGHRMTSWPSLQTDLKKRGCELGGQVGCR